MSIIVIDNQVFHYEVIGRGRPVLFLHGWMGSWRYWLPTMRALSDQYRTYSFNFAGFGGSNTNGGRLGIDYYADQVMRFLDTMGIERVMLVGHSMGGMVALKTALDHPRRIGRLVTVGAPISGTSLSWLLKLTSRPELARTFVRMPQLRRFMFRRFLGETADPAEYEILDDSEKSTSATLSHTVLSMWRTDLRPELRRLAVPTLIVHGNRDEVVNPDQVRLFGTVPAAQVALLPDRRHFPFLEDEASFNLLLRRFLNNEPILTPNRLGARQPATTS